MPKIVLFLAWFSVLSRTIYVIGYLKKGADFRLLGAAFNLFPLYGVAVYSVYVLAGNVFTGGIK